MAKIFLQIRSLYEISGEKTPLHFDKISTGTPQLIKFKDNMHCSSWNLCAQVKQWDGAAP